MLSLCSIFYIFGFMTQEPSTGSESEGNKNCLESIPVNSIFDPNELLGHVVGNPVSRLKRMGIRGQPKQ